MAKPAFEHAFFRNRQGSDLPEEYEERLQDDSRCKEDHQELLFWYTKANSLPSMLERLSDARVNDE